MIYNFYSHKAQNTNQSIPCFYWQSASFSEYYYLKPSVYRKWSNYVSYHHGFFLIRSASKVPYPSV